MENGILNTLSTPNLIMGGTTTSIGLLQSQNCQPSGQSIYINSVTCMRTLSQGNSFSGSPYSSEEYAYSSSFVIEPDASDLAAYNRAAAAGKPYVSDKVGQYLGVGGLQSSVTTTSGAQVPQDVWGANWTVLAGPGTVGGYAGLELDLNNDQQDQMGGRSSFGLWLTGGGDYANHAALYVTGANANFAYQWHDGVHCAYEVEDACIEADSNPTHETFAGINLTGPYGGYGINMGGVTAAPGGLIAMPPTARQVVFDSQSGGGTHYSGYPAAGDVGLLRTPGETLDFFDTAGILVGNVASAQSALVLGQALPSGETAAFGENMASGYARDLLYLGINGTQKARIDNNGNATFALGVSSSSMMTTVATATNISVKSGLYLPTSSNGSNQPLVTTNAGGSVHIQANSGNTGLVVDGPVVAGGTVSLASFSTSALPSACTPGQIAFDGDGRKPGEAAHSGTGVPVVCAYTAQGSSNTTWYAMQVAPVTN